MNNIVVAGAGVFGTAMAERLAWNKNNKVVLHSIEEDVVESINSCNKNLKYFPTRFLNKTITATSYFKVFEQADQIFLIIPSKAIVSFSKTIRQYIKDREPLIINMSKGMSEDGAFLTENIDFKNTASMKGPSFAIEVLNGFPTSFTFGGSKKDYLFVKNNLLPDTGISLDYNKDIRAVELSSILKNMYAIAIGLVSGRYGSANVDFLILTKAINEIKNFMVLYGCSEDVLFNYCGMGDLGLTALNDLSRNRTFGMLIGKGFVHDNTSSTVVEGYRTIKLFGELVREKNIEHDFPIVSALYSLMYEDSTVSDYLVEVLK